MEINITDFMREVETHDLSASRAELGKDAGKITWANAKREAATTQFINAAHRDEFERWVYDFGAWDKDHIKAWPLDECNALLIQFISGDLNTLTDLCHSDSDEFGVDWERARSLSEDGVLSGNIYRGDDGQVYFYMGS